MKRYLWIALLFTAQTAYASTTTVYHCNADGTYASSTTSPVKADYQQPHTIAFVDPCPPVINPGDAFDIACINESQKDAIEAIPTKYRKCLDTNADTKMDSIVEMTQAEKDVVDGVEQTANTASIRASADANVDVFDPDGVIVRALALVIMDEINILRADIDSMSKETNQLVDRNRPARTLNQLKTAIKNEINSGNAD